MSPEVWRFLGQLAIAIVGGGVVVAVINNFLSPKTKAETRNIAAQTAQASIESALANLRADLNDARTQADKADKKADEIQGRFDAVLARDRVLVNYLWELTAWSRRWYDGGHPPGMNPPPKPPAALSDFTDAMGG